MKKRQLSIRVTERMHARIRTEAEIIGWTMNAWIVGALASRLKNWDDWDTGKKSSLHEAEKAREAKYKGWWCEHGTHGDILPASECKYKGSTTHRKSWVNEGVVGGYDEWLEREGEG